MNALDRDALFAACRAIYKLAGEQFMLPPLTRHALHPDMRPGHVYILETGCGAIEFSVALDEIHADRNAAVVSRLPLKFRAQLRRQDGAESVELASDEQFEIVRAFLLGAKAPIAVETVANGSGQRLSIQLSSTFSFDCGAVSDEHADRKDICDTIAAAIFQRSRDLFSDPQNGLAVWQVRAAQELFGDPRPAPETFWPLSTATSATFLATVAASTLPPPAHHRLRYAIAASLLAGFMIPASLFAHFALRDDVSASILAPPSANAALPLLRAVDIRNDHDVGDIGRFNLGPVPRIEPAVVTPSSEPARAEPAKPIMTAKAAPPRPTTRTTAKNKVVSKAKRGAQPKQDDKSRFVNPLPSAKKAVATLTGVVKGIEKIPNKIAMLVKSQNTPRRPSL